MSFALRGAQVVDADGVRPGTDVIVEGAVIRAVGPCLDVEGAAIDAAGVTVTPGFIDVHTHGGGGFDLHTVKTQDIQAYARWAPSTGTTAFLIGVVGVPGSWPREHLQAAVAAIESQPEGAEPLGIHLEGPYINIERRGAHDPSWLRPPNTEETQQLLDLAGRHLRLVTLAPELPGGHEMIRQLVAGGVTVSMGHTDATYEQARAAIGLGVTHTTHCFNAMRPLLHREPGVLGALVEAEGVQGELIADGVHVEPPAMKFLVRALGPERTVVVTDALSVAGMPGATFTFAGQPARVEGGVARLADGSITGSLLTMEQALRNVLVMTGVKLHEAVGMLSLNPARAARGDDRKGRVREGFDADLLVFDSSLRLQATICRGAVAYATDEWRARLDRQS